MIEELKNIKFEIEEVSPDDELDDLCDEPTEETYYSKAGNMVKRYCSKLNTIEKDEHGRVLLLKDNINGHWFRYRYNDAGFLIMISNYEHRIAHFIRDSQNKIVNVFINDPKIIIGDKEITFYNEKLDPTNGADADLSVWANTVLKKQYARNNIII